MTELVPKQVRHWHVALTTPIEVLACLKCLGQNPRDESTGHTRTNMDNQTTAQRGGEQYFRTPAHQIGDFQRSCFPLFAGIAFSAGILGPSKLSVDSATYLR